VRRLAGRDADARDVEHHLADSDQAPAHRESLRERAPQGPLVTRRFELQA
jgi:hypothetical protein